MILTGGARKMTGEPGKSARAASVAVMVLFSASACTAASGDVEHSGMPIPLYPKAAPTGKTPEIDESFHGSHIIRDVMEATLEAFLPTKAKATGAAVIVAPGGAFLMLSIDSEGRRVAA